MVVVVPDASGGAGKQASGREMGKRNEGRCDVFASRCESER